MLIYLAKLRLFQWHARYVARTVISTYREMLTSRAVRIVKLKLFRVISSRQLGSCWNPYSEIKLRSKSSSKKKLIIASTDRQQRSLSYPPYTHFSDYVTKDAVGSAISTEANKSGLYRHFISQKV